MKIPSAAQCLLVLKLKPTGTYQAPDTGVTNMFYQDNYVITCNARVLWDGITRPEPLDGGGQKHSMKVALIASAAEVGELQSILNKELAAGEFRGQLPPGALPGMGDTRPGEFGDMLPGHKVINSVTYNGAPDVYDINGQKLDPMHYAAILYPGATVQLIVSARTYNNKSKGLGFWLNGIKIIDATSAKLPVGSGSIDAGAAFSGAQQQQPAHGATQQTQAAASSAQAATNVQDASSAVPAPGCDDTPPPPAAQVHPDQDFLNVNGKQFSVTQLKAANWSDQQIDAKR
jgi:hypothetical protein